MTEIMDFSLSSVIICGGPLANGQSLCKILLPYLLITLTVDTLIPKIGESINNAIGTKHMSTSSS